MSATQRHVKAQLAKALHDLTQTLVDVATDNVMAGIAHEATLTQMQQDREEYDEREKRHYRTINKLSGDVASAQRKANGETTP